MKTLQATEKKYWVNGHQIRGGWFHTLNFNLFSLGIMISWGKNKMRGIELFRLV